MHVFISAGEPSGDLHAASLAREIRRRWPDARISGFGGSHLEKAGATVLYPLVELAVMWFGRVLMNLHKFAGILGQADRFFRDERPDVVVLIDYPGLHWRIAKIAKRRGIPVVFHVPPQIWAWAGWRVKKIRRDFDEVYCSLPFEPEWYRQRGVHHATYVGHPYFDEIAERPPDRDFIRQERARPGRRVAILPGSRTQEIEKNLPTMLKAADRLARDVPDVRFLVAALDPSRKALIHEVMSESEAASGLTIDVYTDKTTEIIHVSETSWAVSGSVGLELLAAGLPSAVVYHISPSGMWLARAFMKVKYISLVNLLADEEVFPEYLATSAQDVSPQLADWARRWLTDPKRRRATTAKLEALRDRIAQPGATRRVVDRLAILLDRRATTPYPGPHAPLSPRQRENVEHDSLDNRSD